MIIVMEEPPAWEDGRFFPVLAALFSFYPVINKPTSWLLIFLIIDQIENVLVLAFKNLITYPDDSICHLARVSIITH
jgi:hypothetical protein